MLFRSHYKAKKSPKKTFLFNFVYISTTELRRSSFKNRWNEKKKKFENVDNQLAFSKNAESGVLKQKKPCVVQVDYRNSEETALYLL